MSTSCPPGGRNTHGPQMWPGACGGHTLGLVLDWGGHQVWGAASGLGPPIPQPLLRAGGSSSCCTDPTQQAAAAPPAPDTPNGLGTPPSLGCSPQTPHSPQGEPGPATVPPLPPRGRMRVHPSQAHCQPPPRETPALWHSGAGWGQHQNSHVPPVLGGGCGASPLHLAPRGAPALPSSARDTLAPSRLYTGVSNVAAFALLIPRGLHPPKTPLPPWGCGFPGWAGEGSLCPAAGGRGELLARHRSPGALGGGRGAPSRDQTSVEAQGGARVSMHVRVWAHECPGTGAHVLHMAGLGSWPGFTPTPRGAPHPPPHLGTFS